MASRMRRVRRELRQQMLSAVNGGEGNLETLTRLAGGLFGQQVGYEVLIKTFLASEVSNGLAQLRSEGLVESTGKIWKSADRLESEDVDTISIRRWKRLRGELKSEIRMAHEYGRTEEAAAAGRMLEIVGQELESAIQEESTVAQ